MFPLSKDLVSSSDADPALVSTGLRPELSIDFTRTMSINLEP